MSKSHSLKETAVKAVAAPVQGYSLTWDDPVKGCPGFGLRTTSTGTKSFILQYNMHGRKRRITIGRWPAWTVTAARERALELYRKVQSDQDPMQQRLDAREQARITLQSYLEETYSVVQSRRKSGAQTLAMIRKSFKPLLNCPLTQISESDIDAWRDRMEANGRSFATIKRHYDALNGLLNHAARKTIPANPLAGHRLEQAASTEDEQKQKVTKRDILAEDEIRALFAGLEQFNEWKRARRARSRKAGKDHLPDLSAATFAHPAVPFIRLAYFTGFRPGDLFGLQWEHVQFEQRIIRKVIEKTAAKRPEPQNFALSDAALQTLLDWHNDQGKPKAGYVFASERTGGRMDKHAMRTPWKKIKRMGGLSADLDLYTLRHNFGSQLIKAGVDLFAVSKLMAHTDIQTTIRNYAHHAPSAAAAQVNMMPGAANE